MKALAYIQAVVKKSSENFVKRRHQRKMALRGIFYTIRFYSNFKYKFIKRYGLDLDFRLKNHMRRCFTFAGQASLMAGNEKKCKKIVADFFMGTKPLIHFFHKIIQYK